MSDGIKVALFFDHIRRFHLQKLAFEQAQCFPDRKARSFQEELVDEPGLVLQVVRGSQRVVQPSHARWEARRRSVDFWQYQLGRVLQIDVQ